MKVNVFAVVSMTTGQVIGEYLKLNNEKIKMQNLTFALVQHDEEMLKHVEELPVIQEDTVMLSSNKGHIDELKKMQNENPYRTFIMNKNINGYDLMLCLERQSFLDRVKALG